MQLLTITTALVAGLVLCSAADLPADLNSFSFMARYTRNGHNGAACVDTWNRIKNQYYSGANAACGDLVKKAMDTYVPSQCPGGPPYTGDKPGGELWNCMTGNGTNADLKSAFFNFVRGCEIFYVAQRDRVESEDGFVALQNSCLRRFADAGEFQAYLNANPNAAPGGSAEALVPKLVPILAALFAASLLILLL